MSRLAHDPGSATADMKAKISRETLNGGSLHPAGSVTDMIGDICNVPTSPGYRDLEQEAVDFLLDGIPAKGGYVSHYMLEKIVRAAFRGGIMATKPKSPNDKGQR